MNISNKILSLSTCLLLAGTAAHAQWTGPKKKPETQVEVKYGPISPANRTDANMEAFLSYPVEVSNTPLQELSTFDSFH